LTVAAFFCLAAALPLAAAAQGILPECTKDGNCDLSQFLEGFVNLANYGLGILGIAGVTMFVVGGLYLLLSAGRAAMVSRGKSILAGATTGILIVLFSWVTIGFVYVALTGDTQGTIFKGVAGVKPQSFFQPTKPKTNCSAVRPPYLDTGCTESVTNGPIHATYAILNSKPGCSLGVVSGEYTSTLKSVVGRFQQNNGLAVDGIVGPETWDALHQSNADCIPDTSVDPDGNVVPKVPGGCCRPTDMAVGSCAIGYSDASLCGDNFTFNAAPCNDILSNYLACTMPASSGNKWGTCTFNFTGTGGAESRTWPTGTVACNAVSGSIP
jgi:peptidoglycan hydrolase-like protein with peptidoglycan-binding domain